MKNISNFIQNVRNRYGNRIQIKRMLLVILSLFIINNLVFLYNNAQNKTPILGLRFENHFLIGKNHEQIAELVRSEAAKRNKILQFVHNNDVITVQPADIGYAVKNDYLANNLLQEGRKGNMWQKFLFQETALLGLQNERIHGTYSSSLLAIKILDIQSQFDTNPTTITLDFTNSLQTIVPAHDGEKVQVDKLRTLILANINNPPQKPILLPTYVAFPNQHSTNELDPIRQQALSLLTSSISISSGGETFVLTPDDMKQLLTVVERPDSKNPKKTKLVLRLDDTKLNQRLGVFATKVESITHAEFDDHEARVALYAEFYNPSNRFTHVIPTGRRLASSEVLGATDHPGPKIAYLTFDDGPNVLYHPLILDILRTYNVKATFFLVGQNIPTAHDAAIATVRDGHLIGNHSLTHSFLPNLGTASISNELIKTDNILQSITNQPITLFRPPYGGINYYVTTDAHQLGLKIFLWDVDPKDWSEPSTDELVRRVVSSTHDGSNILLHSNHLATIKALPHIIETLQLEGYTFHTLADYPSPEQL